MNQTRGFLFILLAVFSFLLFQAYTQDNYDKPKLAEQQANLVSKNLTDTSHNLTISNGLLNLTVNTITGDFVGGTLTKYSTTINDNIPLPLISDNQANYLLVINGLYGAQGTDSDNYRANYQILSKTSSSITLQFVKNNVTYYKNISVQPNSYVVNVKYTVQNHSGQNISLAPYSVFANKEMETSSLFSRQNNYGTNSSYAGVVVSTEKDNYDKVSYGTLKDNFQPIIAKKGWVAISQHFFVSAYIPEQQDPFTITSIYNKQSQVINLNILSKLITIAPNSTHEFSDKYWFGPKLQKQLAQVAPDLNLTVDYGWAWFLSTPLFWLMSFLHKFIPNWGLTIIALTFVVRLIIFPLSRIQFKNQALMRVVQPELAVAIERAGDDRMKRMIETQNVYKKYGASQFTGCLPALIQAPIFLALFYLVNEAVELRHQPFFGWINDLSQSDPYFILPILNGLIMVYMFSLSPTPEGMDPTQKKIMKAMPYMFMIFLMFLPSGLILYYIVSNLITIAIMTYYNRKISAQYKNHTLKTYKVTASKTYERMQKYQELKNQANKRK